jgi:arylsulfatase A-like enzyme
MAKRNVILVTIDSLRRDFLGCYGYANNTSPTIDRLAKKGVLFENAWANGPNTPHAFKSIMVGKYPLEEPGYGVFDKRTYLPHIFKRYGYYTIGIVAGNPLVSRYYGYDDGFDVFADFMDEWGCDARAEKVLTKMSAILKRASKTFAYHIGTSFYVFVMSKLYNFLQKKYKYGAWTPLYSYHEVLNKLESILYARAEKIRQDKIFLWLHFMDVHHPYNKPEDVSHGMCQSLHDLINFQDRSKRIPRKRIGIEVTTKIRKMYEQSIRDVDSGLDKLLLMLNRYKLLNNFSIFILSDHGDLLGEHRLLGHRRLIHNELLRIPALVYDNNISMGDNVYKDPISQRDIYQMIVLSRECSVSEVVCARTQNHKVFSEMYSDEFGGMYLDGHKNEINLFKLDETAERLYSLIRGDMKLAYYKSKGKYIFSDLSDNALEISPTDKIVCRDMIEMLNQHVNEEQESREISKRRRELYMAISKIMHKLYVELKDNGKDAFGNS